jgi:hypothetical protein
MVEPAKELKFRQARQAEKDRCPCLYVAIDQGTGELVGRVEYRNGRYGAYVPFDAAEPFHTSRRLYHCWEPIEHRYFGMLDGAAS